MMRHNIVNNQQQIIQDKRSYIICGRQSQSYNFLLNSRTSPYKCTSIRQVGEMPKASSVRSQPRDSIRLGLPSKGRMADDTIQLLEECQLGVKKINPRQYVAKISQLPQMEVWFQRASDVVRKLVYADVDLGIVGYDMYREIGHDSDDLVLLHDSLGFGQCHLALGVPQVGMYSSIETIEQLLAMEQWSETRPMRIVTGYPYLCQQFMAERNFKNVKILSADGALEAAPAMGSADIIFDLVSTGVTLRENNLKEIDGGTVIESQGVLVANKGALLSRPGLLPIVRELIERLDAHLKARQFYSVQANMRGDDSAEIANSLLTCKDLSGLQGPTIAPVYTRASDGTTGKEPGFYAATVCVPRKQLYSSIKSIRQLGGSGVLVSPVTYIFDETPPRWVALIEQLGGFEKVKHLLNE